MDRWQEGVNERTSMPVSMSTADRYSSRYRYRFDAAAADLTHFDALGGWSCDDNGSA